MKWWGVTSGWKKNQLNVFLCVQGDYRFYFHQMKVEWCGGSGKHSRSDNNAEPSPRLLRDNSHHEKTPLQRSREPGLHTAVCAYILGLIRCQRHMCKMDWSYFMAAFCSIGITWWWASLWNFTSLFPTDSYLASLNKTKRKLWGDKDDCLLRQQLRYINILKTFPRHHVATCNTSASFIAPFISRRKLYKWAAQIWSRTHLCQKLTSWKPPKKNDVLAKCVDAHVLQHAWIPQGKKGIRKHAREVNDVGLLLYWQ